MTPTRLDWTITAAATTNVSIQGAHFDIFFEQAPGDGVPRKTKGNFTVTGNVGGGVWDAAAHQVTYIGGSGLIAHSTTFDTTGMSLSGTLRDTSQSLVLTD